MKSSDGNHNKCRRRINWWARTRQSATGARASTFWSMEWRHASITWRAAVSTEEANQLLQTNWIGNY